MFSPMSYIQYILYNNTNSLHGGHLRWPTADNSPITLPLQRDEKWVNQGRIQDLKLGGRT
jgi:hypothetical protein